jgi:hypothetical protein
MPLFCFERALKEERHFIGAEDDLHVVFWNGFAMAKDGRRVGRQGRRRGLLLTQNVQIMEVEVIFGVCSKVTRLID